MTQSYVRVSHLAEVDHRRPTYVAIGSFDGVHLGHQELLRQMVAQAHADSVRAAVLTFFPHPRRVLQTLPPRFYITTLDDRVRLLGATGVDLIITHPFNDEVRHIRAGDFVDQLLEALDMKQLWGAHFAFGYQREGNILFLQEQGRERGFSVELVQAPVMLNDELVSSSRVRRGMEAGDMADVNACLGRAFSVRGIVAKGDQRGRTIGFPTANLALWDELLLPANGVYATYAWLGERRFAAATNVGVRPTVDGQRLTVEAHLLDFNEDIYGEEMCLEFVGHVRPETKFAGLEALKAQIQADVDEVRRIAHR